MTHTILRPAALAAIGFAALLSAGCADTSMNRGSGASSGDYSRSGSGSATSGGTTDTRTRSGPGTQGPSGTSGTSR